jgi:hypothetical protein
MRGLRPFPPPGARWRFNGGGECVKMPSTNLCRGVGGEAQP